MEQRFECRRIWVYLGSGILGIMFNFILYTHKIYVYIFFYYLATTIGNITYYRYTGLFATGNPPQIFFYFYVICMFSASRYLIKISDFDKYPRKTVTTSNRI